MTEYTNTNADPQHALRQRLCSEAENDPYANLIGDPSIKSESSYAMQSQYSRKFRTKQTHLRHPTNDDDFHAADSIKLRAFDGLSNDERGKLDYTLDSSSLTIGNGVKNQEGTKSGVRKMGTVQTFFAVLKAYCAINVLLLPRSFANGGYLLSPCAMLVAVFFEGLCAARLSTVGHMYGIYSYPLLMQKALGEKGL